MNDSSQLADSFVQTMLDALAPYTVLLIIGGVIALVFLLWYLWSMGRLFPRLGLSAGQGWIPIWNEWKLMTRMGLPGWTALLYLVGLGIVPLIIRTVAQHRVGRQAGVGGGYTVLGFFIAPLWATLMGSLLEGQVLGGSRTPIWPGAGAPLGAPGYGTVPGPVAAADAVNPYAPPSMGGGLAAPQSPQMVPGQSPWNPAGSAQQPVAPALAQPPAPSLNVAAAPQLPSTPFTAETEAEYARLANEAFLSPPATPLGRAAASEPFSWTAASQSVEPDPAPPVQAPPLHPISVAAAPRITPAAPVVPAAPPILPAQPSLTQATASSAAFSGSASAPQIPLPPGEQTRTNAVEQGAAAPLSAPASQSGITANYNPLPSIPRSESDEEFDRTVVVQRASGTGWELMLPSGESLALAADTIVGRRPQAADGAEALQIPDPTRTLSKMHARFRLDEAGWTVEDLGSTNGVYLLDATGAEHEVVPGAPARATEQLLLGTLPVQLRRTDGAR